MLQIIKKFIRPVKNNTGSTLVELMIAVYILLVGTLSTMMFFVQSKVSMRLSQDIVTATTYTESIMEEMRARPTLADIVNTDWSAWAQSQNWQVLPNQSVSVTLPTDTTEDPLKIITTTSWTRNGRPANVTLETHLTKY